MTIRNTLSAATVTLCTCTPALLAQKPAASPESEGGYIQWLVALGLVGLVCATAFMNPKRTHQT
jgi:hypothetical protein